MRHVDAFLNHAPRLLDQFGIDDGQERRVVADVVFDHEQDGHANGLRVMQHVAFIFDVFDDGDQNTGIALPQKNAFDFSKWIARDEILDLAIVVAKNNDRNIETGAFDLAGQLRRVHIAHGEVGDDEIEMRIGTGQSSRFRATGDVGNSGNLLQVEFERFVDEQLVETPVFAQE